MIMSTEPTASYEGGKMSSIMDSKCSECKLDIPIWRNRAEPGRFVAPHDSVGNLRPSWPMSKLCKGSFAQIENEPKAPDVVHISQGRMFLP